MSILIKKELFSLLSVKVGYFFIGKYVSLKQF